MSGYSTTKKTAGPWVDIDLANLCANYSTIHRSAATAEIAAVVKCDAYGLGMEAVAQALVKKENCRTFFVAYPEEGAALRHFLSTTAPAAKIYIFNGPLPETRTLFQNAKLTPVLNSLEQSAKWASQNPGSPAALHVDTGMNRLGAPLSELGDIATLDGLNIELVMSHLACASDPADYKNAGQRDLFHQVAAKFPDAHKSLSASGGALMDESFHLDLIRPGIALYGGSPFETDDTRIQPVASLRAPVVQLRTIAPGETVGYSAKFVADRPTKLATVALGYGDGFPRAGGDRSKATIKGALVKVAGAISMDLISLDVTDVETPVTTGDIATFFGDGVGLFDAAKACNTVPYEMLTGLGGRVDRRYV